MRGTSKEFKQNEAQKFISDNKLHVCGILETHLKTHNIARLVNNFWTIELDL